MGDADVLSRPQAGTERWEVAGQELCSRLILGTGGVQSLEVLRQITDASGTALATVAMRRVAPAGDGEVVPRGAWGRTPLAAGARVEIVTAVQGG